MGNFHNEVASLRAALAASEARLSAVLDTVLDAVIGIDAGGVIEAANQAACKLFGYEAGELIGRNVTDLMPEPHRTLHPEYLSKYQRTREAKIIGIGREVMAQRKDGSRFLAHLGVTESVIDGHVRYTGVLHDLTRRESDRRRLEEVATRLERAVEGSSDGIWEINLADPNDYYYSPRMRELIGADEHPGLRFKDVVLEDEWDRSWNELTPKINRFESFEYTYRCRLPNGQFRWLRTRAKAYPNEAGEPALIAGAVTDVTDLLRAEWALQSARERYELAIQGTSDGIWERNLLDPSASYQSRRLREILGTTGKPEIMMEELMTPAEAKRLNEAIRLHIDAGVPLDLTLPITTLQGESIWARIRGKSTLSEATGQVRVVGSLSDVTKEVQAERELQMVRERLELAINGTFDGIWDWNLLDGSSYESPRMLEMLELDRHPHLSLQDLMSPQEIERMNAACLAHLYEGRSYDHEFPLTLPSGRARWFRVRGQAVFDEKRTPIRMAGSISDVTDRRSALAALEEMTQTLSARVHERTADLRRANVELERAARAKDAFLAGMSHELRTPLNAILGLSEALAEGVYGPLSPEQRKPLATIETSGKHLLALISDVLDLAKIHAGRMRLESAPASIRDLVLSSVAYVRRSAEKSGIHLAITEIDPSLGMTTDGRRLKQVLINLLSNAVKFTPPSGRVLFDVRAHRDEEVVEFIVEDTGIGIEETRQKEIFEPFRQVDSKLSREYEGTGLGLALVRELVDAFGGSVSVQSELGRGSRFTVRIPWVPVPDLESGGGPLEGLPRRAILVEDNEADAERVARLLRSFGIETCTLRDTTSIVDRIHEVQAEVLILDIVLPDENGWEFMRRIRDLHEQIPIIVVSVLDDPAVSAAHGAIAHITKPCEREELLLALRRAGLHRNPRHAPANELLRGKHVLLAEDNEANQQAMGDYLRSQGLQVNVATNGLEAVAAAGEADLIVMDIQMPVMDGLEAIQRIRANEMTSTIPIIAVTALAMRGDRERCLSAGATHYLSKPVRLVELYRTIAHCLGGQC
jgi:PAS domain S-box-containing protein